MPTIAIIGASGYTGAELLRLIAGHPDLEVVLATGDTQAGVAVAELYPGLAAAYGELRFAPWEPARAAELLAGVDGVFLGLPHGASQQVVGEVLGRVRAVVDLGADFRLPDPATYRQWYGEDHTRADLLGSFAYGLPELHRDAIAGPGGRSVGGSVAVAAPGCYPTAATLALWPLVRAGLVATDHVVVDAVSGVSGAGRPPKPATTFCTVDGDVTAYGLLDHRHTAEMELNLGATVLFTPHLVPMSRGILATCYARPAVEGLTTDDVLGCLRAAYAAEPFVVVTDASPSTKATLGTNCAHVTARADARTGTVLAIGAIDNLGKGAAGQAVQCMNLALGLSETAGLPLVGVTP